MNTDQATIQLDRDVKEEDFVLGQNGTQDKEIKETVDRWAAAQEGALAGWRKVKPFVSRGGRVAKGSTKFLAIFSLGALLGFVVGACSGVYLTVYGMEKHGYAIGSYMMSHGMRVLTYGTAEESFRWQVYAGGESALLDESVSPIFSGGENYFLKAKEEAKAEAEKKK